MAQLTAASVRMRSSTEACSRECGRAGCKLVRGECGGQATASRCGSWQDGFELGAATGLPSARRLARRSTSPPRGPLHAGLHTHGVWAPAVDLAGRFSQIGSTMQAAGHPLLRPCSTLNNRCKNRSKCAMTVGNIELGLQDPVGSDLSNIFQYCINQLIAVPRHQPFAVCGSAAALY